VTEHYALVFLLSLAVLLGVARLLGELARAVGLPLVVGEIIAGILLGETGLGRLAPSVHAFLLPKGVPASMLSGYTTVAVVLLLVVAGLGKLAVRLLDARAGVVLQAVMPAVVVPAGCHGAGVKVKGAVSTQSFLCQSGMLRVIATAIPAGANPSRILEVARGPASRGLEGNVDMQPWRTPSGDAWMLVIAHDSSRQSAFTSIVGHRHLLSGLGDRIRMARAMTSGAPSLAVAMTYESEAADAMAQLQGFISAQPVW